MGRFFAAHRKLPNVRLAPEAEVNPGALNVGYRITGIREQPLSKYLRGIASILGINKLRLRTSSSIPSRPAAI